MARNSSSPRQPAPHADVSPSLRRRADVLLNRMAALDGEADQPTVNVTREHLRQQARAIGMRLVSFTVTAEPIPDPALIALPAADLKRIEAITRDMRARPQRHVAELEYLVSKHPHIPMLYNHLAGALEAAGHQDRAAEIISETVRRFPTYIFAFCSHVMVRLSQGQVEEARTMVEKGPRGPVLTLIDFDPTRDTFHISEATSHAAMVGHYLLATGRREAAEVQLKMLRETAPDSPQYRALAVALARADDSLDLAAAFLRLAADRQLRRERPVKAARKSRTKRKNARESETPATSVIEKPNSGLFDPSPNEA